MEILHEDYLERCVNTTNKKEYKKQYFVFRQDSAGGKTLEYFKDTNWRKSEPRGVCNLFNGYAVSVLGPNETKKKYGIELKTVGKTFELHASSEQSRDTWLAVLNRDIQNFYNAKLLESPPNAYSVVRLLTGQIHLQITDCSVVLLGNRVPAITWRFGTIRRYKSKDGAFVLEVGRKAPTGEGIFRFQVQDPNKLFDELDRALKQRIALKRHQDSSFDTINRTSSFDGQIPDRRSMNLRSPSIEERPLPASPPGYSCLDQVPIPRPSPGLPPEVNGYDRLFGDTIPPSPHSPLPPTPPPLTVFNNRSIIGRRPTTVPDVEQPPDSPDGPDENYIDMSGVKEELIRESRNIPNKGPEIKPRPVPRPGRPPPNISLPIPFISSDTANRVISSGVSDVDLIDLNTYECPIDSEYHALNSRTPPKSVSPASGYDHLTTLSVNKTTTSVSNCTQNVLNGTQSMTNTTQSVIYNTQSVTNSTQSVTDSTQSVTDSTQSVTNSTQSVTNSTQSVTKSTQSVTNSTQSLTDSTQSNTPPPIPTSTRPVSSSSYDMNENIYGNSIVEELQGKLNKKQSNAVLPAVSKPTTIEHARKPPPPVPIRPQPPVRRPRRGSDRINSCESLPDTVLVLGKTSSSHSNPNSSETLLYDSPRGIMQNELASNKKAQSLNADVFLYMDRNENLSEYQIPRSDET